MALTVAIYWVTVCFSASYSQVFADEIDFPHVLSELANFKVKHGFSPSDDDFFAIVLKPGYDFTFQEIEKLWKIVVDQQKSVISVDQLVALYRSKKSSIKDVCAVFKTTSYQVDPSTNESENFEIVYGYINKGDKYYLNTRMLGGHKEVIPDKTQSYDGEICYSFLDISGSLPVVGIDHLSSMSIFFQSYSPLASSMLLNSKLFERQDTVHDIIAFLETPGTAVFERTEVVDLQECIVVANWGTRVSLSPKHDFSVVQVIDYRHHFRESAEQPFLTARSVSERRVLHELKDYGNGVWLPNYVLVDFFFFFFQAIGKAAVRTSLLEVNNGVSDNVFTDFIPQNAFVLDFVRDMSYDWTEYPSIEGLLNSVVKSERVWAFQIISVTLGIIMIIIALIVMFLKRRNAA
jgi:hypothetical protein